MNEPELHTAVGTGAGSTLLVDEIAGDDALLLSLLASGMMIGAVARRMHLSERTIRRRLRALCDRLDVATPVQAVVWAVRAGVLDEVPAHGVARGV